LVLTLLDIHLLAQVLRRRPSVVLATPGRLVDHVQNSAGVAFDDVDVCVLDEADKLLDLGFEDQLKHVVGALPGGGPETLGSGRGKRQTLLFSATFGARVESLASLSLKRPIRVKLDAGRAAGGVVARLTQDVVKLTADAKKDGPDAELLEREATFAALLSRLLLGSSSPPSSSSSSSSPPGVEEEDTTKKKKKKKSSDELAVAFFDTRAQARRMGRVLRALDIEALELHGGLPQAERSQNLSRFQKGEVRCLLCTDVAARGLDVDGVRVVLNFDMPRTVETYVHRVGRTARAGRTGLAVTVVGAGRRAVLKEYLRSRRADLDAAGLDDEKEEPIRARKVPSGVVDRFRDAIAASAAKIDEFEKEDQALAEQRDAERDTDRAYNLVAHADEIKSRAKRTWVLTGKEKDALKEKERAENQSEALAADHGRLQAAEKKKKKIKDDAMKALGVSVKGKRARREDDAPGHRLTRKKRRRLEAARAEASMSLEEEVSGHEEEDEGVASGKKKKKQQKVDFAAVQSAREAAAAAVKRDARKAKRKKDKTDDDGDFDVAAKSGGLAQRAAKKKTSFADVDGDDDDNDDVGARGGARTTRKFTDFDPSRVGQRKKKDATGSFKSKARYKRR